MPYDFSPKQSKHAVLNGLMRSKNISGLIGEALQSPMGSTSRKKAQKIVSLMRKFRSGDAIDGQGGPGYATIEQPSQYAQAMGEPVIFPSPPEMRIPMDGQGGPGFTSPGTWTTPYSGTTPSGGDALSNLQNFSNIVGPQASLPTSNPAPGGGGFNIPALSPTGGISSAPQTTQPAPSGTNIPWGNISLSSAATAPAQTAFQMPQSTPQQQQAPQTYNAPMAPAGGSAGAPSPLTNAVASNLGPDAFALSMLSNPDALRHLPGFDKLPASAIPTGASLAGQVDMLADTLRHEYNLDNLLNQKNSMIKNGMTLTTDLTDYIRGRDQFLNQTQGMIDQYTDKMRTMDLANPNVAGRANQYMNYLYELRGRQNKRYIEFLNGSIGVYNAQLADVSNNYDKALSSYQSELQLKANVTQTEYNMYYTALTGMYNASQQAPILAKQQELLQAQIDATNHATALDGVNQGKGLLDDFNTIRTKAQGLLVDKDGNLLPTVNSLRGAVDTIAGDGSVPVTSAMQFMVSGMLNGIDAATDPATASRLASKYLGWTADLYTHASSEQDATNASLIRSSLQQTMSSNLRSSLSKDPTNLSALRNDLNGMINPGFFSKGPDQKTFASRYGSLLGSDLANSLWAGVKQFTADSGKVDLPPTTNTSELASWISDIAADSYVSNIWNTAIQQQGQ